MLGLPAFFCCLLMFLRKKDWWGVKREDTFLGKKVMKYCNVLPANIVKIMMVCTFNR